MSKWLQKAMGRDSGSSDHAIPVPFEMMCLCGKALTGQRQARARRVICSSCGRAQFILPVNQYPESTWKYFGGIVTEPEDEFPASDAEVANDVADSKARKPQVAPRKPKPKRQEAEQEAESSDDDQIRMIDDEPESRPQPTSPRRKSVRLDAIEMAPLDRPNSRGKVLVILAVLAVVVVLSIGTMLIKHRRESAELRYKQGSEAGHKAYAEHDFGKARHEFESAMQAAQILNLTPTQTEAVRFRQRHTEAILRLVDLDLFDLVGLPASETSGRWLILQVPVATQTIEIETKSVVEWNVFGSSKSVRIRGLDLVAEIARRKNMTEVILAAPVLKIETPDAGASYIVHVDKEQAFLWQEFESLRQLGFVGVHDEETMTRCLKLVQSQAEASRTATVPEAKVTAP